MPDDQILSRVVEGALGVAKAHETPVSMQTQAAAATTAVPAKENNESGEAPKTPAEQIAEKGAKTEADAMGDSPMEFEIDWADGKKRKITASQIKGTFERYAALNEKHGALKPLISLAEQIQQETGASPEDVAKYIIQIAAQQGDAKPDAKGETPAAKEGKKDLPGDDDLSRWEQENAAALPPGYREQFAMIREFGAQMQNMQQMMAQLLGSTGGTTDAARQAVQQAQGEVIDARRQRVSSNLDFVQQKLALPVEAAQDFMMFAGERGYTLEDFIDPELTLRVATDFKNAMNSPEMERLKAIAAKRQAFTSAGVGSGPNSGPAAGPAQTDPNAEMFGKLAQAALAKRGIG